MYGKDLIRATLFGGGSSTSGGSSGGGSGIPQADIDAAFAALTEKGVTVPDGATSADLDELIASIVAGGNFTTGTFTLAENTSDYEFAQYDPEKYKTGVPNFVVVRRIDGYSAEGDHSWIILASIHLTDRVFQVGMRNESGGCYMYGKTNSSDKGFYVSNSAGIIIDGALGNHVLRAYAFAYTMTTGTYAYIFGDLC